MVGLEILSAIAPFKKEGRTGTVIAVFDDSSLARICLVNGKITSARLQDKKGNAAMELARSMNLVSIMFHNNSDIAGFSEQHSSDSENGDPGPPSQPPADQPSTRATEQETPKQEASTEGNPLSELGRRRLSDLLTEYIGPVSPLVMSDLKENVDIDTALNIVAREFEDPRRAAVFIAAAKRIL